MRFFLTLFSAAVTVAVSITAQAFCGFYVARADTKLYNQASQVVLVRDDDRTVITMANDFQGDVSDFAVVIPIPTFIERGQVNVADRAVIEHLDAYTSPRLVEYHDPDPCRRYELDEATRSGAPLPGTAERESRGAARSKGVTIEASYLVGEYDILILSATESEGLIEWLTDNDYRIPEGAGPVVDSYLRQDMRFFVARVNLEEQARLGYANLRPLQVAYESERFMLPIRLGTVNARHEQELFVYALTRKGRVETTNYRTVRLPSDAGVPEFVEGEFGDFYRAMFRRQTARENGRAVFLEMRVGHGMVRPCAAEPLSDSELRQLGVFWLGDNAGSRTAGKRAVAPPDVFVTRLHVRYDKARFPEDLMFHVTGDRSNFQGRYIIRRPWRGELDCDARRYQADVRERQQQEARMLADLTGWNIERCARIDFLGRDGDADDDPWWKKLWQ